MITPLLRSIVLVAVLVLMNLLTGCTHVIKPPKTAYTGYPSKEKITFNVALNITDELLKSKWEYHTPIGGDTFIIPVGASMAENTAVLARHTFSTVQVITNNARPTSSVEAVLTPKVPYINRTAGSTSFSESIVAIKLEWTLNDTAGNTIWADTVTGQGTGSTGWSKPEDVVKRAWEDVLKKSYRTLWYARSIREFARKSHPEVQFAALPAPIQNPEVKRLCDLLESADVDQVMDSLKTLRKMDAPEAVPEILNCLEHSDPYVVRDACRTLAVLGKKQHIPLLEPLLKNKESDVRKDAKKAIEALSAKP
jgi:hypothetical protein